MLEYLFKRMTVSKAVRILKEEMLDDPGLYYGYQANIAMTFYDTVKEYGINIDDKTLHEISNNAAVRFLNKWCS
jgi:diaminopimelate decarboxylase